MQSTLRHEKDELDFQYMLARDPDVSDDILAYAGDRFIESNVSPQKRVLDARRGFARAELLTCSYSQLLVGVLY